MSRVCMLNPFFLPYQGGTEKHIFEVGRRLVDKGFDVTVLSVRLPKTKAVEDICGMRVRRVSALAVVDSLPTFSPVPSPIAVAPSMGAAIRTEFSRQDLFHIHNRFFYSPDDAKAVAKAGRKLCLTLHNARPQGISPTTDFFGAIYDETNGRAIMKECDRILGVSRNTLDVTVPKAFRAKCSVAYNGVDTVAYSPRVDGSRKRRALGLEGKKVILTVCRLESQKGLDYLLSAMRLLAAKDGSFHWVLVGTGSQEENLRKKASASLGSGHFTMIARKLPDTDVTELYAAADAFVLPSVWEPFGMVICEAMSSGKPVVSTRVGGIPEIVTPDCGLLCRPRDPRDLAAKISALFSDPKAMARMGTAGRKRVERSFTWDRTAQAYVRLYESLL